MIQGERACIQVFGQYTVNHRNIGVFNHKYVPSQQNIILNKCIDIILVLTYLWHHKMWNVGAILGQYYFILKDNYKFFNRLKSPILKNSFFMLIENET